MPVSTPESFKAAAHETRQRCAPYNFARLEPVVLESPVYDGQPEEPPLNLIGQPFADGISGCLKVTWIAETPLLVGGDSNNSPFQYRGVYALPGASLRGMIRSVLEAATCSSIQEFVDNRFLGFRDYDAYSWRRYGPNPQSLQAGWLYPKNRNWSWKRPDTIEWCLKPCPDAAGGRNLKKKGGPGWVGVDIHKLVAVLLSRLGGSWTWDLWLKKSLHEKRTALLAAGLAGRIQLGTIDPLHPLKDQWGTLVHAGITPDVSREDGRNPKQDHRKCWEAFFLEPDADAAPLPISEATFRRFHAIQHRTSDSKSQSNSKTKDQNTRNSEEEDQNPPQETWQYWCWLLHHPDSCCHIARIPVFFVGDPAKARDTAWPKTGQPFVMSLTRLMRLPYRYSIHEVLHRTIPDQGKRRRLDFCQALFGHVPINPPEAPRIDSEQAWRGRVAFSFASLDPPAGAPSPSAWPLSEQQGVTMTPRPTYYPFYLRPEPTASFPIAPVDWSSEQARLAGRKRYPARGQAGSLAPAGGQEGNQIGVTLQFLESCAGKLRFSSEIRFHNLRPVELGALLWGVTWGDLTGTGPYRHMLGRGKSFGFGQMRVVLAPPASHPEAPDSPQASWLETNNGSPPPTFAALVTQFKNWLYTAWRTARATDTDATSTVHHFIDLPHIQDLLALANTDIGRVVHPALVFPQSDTGKDIAERTVKGYQVLKQAINKAYLSTETGKTSAPDPNNYTLPCYPHAITGVNVRVNGPNDNTSIETTGPS